VHAHLLGWAELGTLLGRQALAVKTGLLASKLEAASVLLQGHQQQDCGCQLRHLRHLCNHRGRPLPCFWVEQLWPAGAARCTLEPGAPPVVTSALAAEYDGHCLGSVAAICVSLAAGQVPIYAPTLVKAFESKDIALVRSGQHHTLALTHAGTGHVWQGWTAGAWRRFLVALIVDPSGKVRAERFLFSILCEHSPPICDAAGKLLSFGRPTYGRLGQQDADVAADSGGWARLLPSPLQAVALGSRPLPHLNSLNPTCVLFVLLCLLTACPEPKEVDGLEGVKVVGAAAGLAVSGAYLTGAGGCTQAQCWKRVTLWFNHRQSRSRQLPLSSCQRHCNC
jgi:hypothetical protein